ncbi:MAG: hypothetical protein SFX19_10000 [Alphaproteobacteria bacterium]|nr:hypothetical protein [Alphaproteobacteria bacterium]
MTGTIDMFTEYQPTSPASRSNDTSLFAAAKISHCAAQLRAQVLEHLRNCGAHGATPDETADALQKDILNIRPRFTELKLDMKIADSGARRKNSKGNTAKVWIAI